MNLNRINAPINKVLIKKLTLNNACIHFNIFKLNHHLNTRTCVLKYIERWFTTIVKKKKQVELSFDLVKEIFSSSQLNVSSEVEVLKAADAWLKYDIDKRFKFAIKLIKTIRLPLIPVADLKKLLQDSSFSRCPECRNYIYRVFTELLTETRSKNCIHRQVRYCDQQNFDLLVYGWKKENANSNLMYALKGEDFSTATEVATMMGTKIFCLSVVIDEKIYCLSESSITSYSMITKKLKNRGKLQKLSELPKRRKHYCACSFMGMIFIIGGLESRSMTKRCLAFDPKYGKWKRIAMMREYRLNAACAVLAGKIVVSGGCGRSTPRIGDIDNPRGRLLRTVEVYDHFASRWMPSMRLMVEGRCGHASVSIGNKLYVVGGSSVNCEVYDHHTDKFVMLKSKLPLNANGPHDLLDQCVAIGSKIWLFKGRTNKAFVFDVDEKEWSLVENFGADGYFGFSYVRFPSN